MEGVETAIRRLGAAIAFVLCVIVVPPQVTSVLNRRPDSGSEVTASVSGAGVPPDGRRGAAPASAGEPENLFRRLFRSADAAPEPTPLSPQDSNSGPDRQSVFDRLFAGAEAPSGEFSPAATEVAASDVDFDALFGVRGGGTLSAVAAGGGRTASGDRTSGGLATTATLGTPTSPAVFDRPTSPADDIAARSGASGGGPVFAAGPPGTLASNGASHGIPPDAGAGSVPAGVGVIGDEAQFLTLDSYGVGMALDLNVIGSPMLSRTEAAPLSLADCVQMALDSSPQIASLRTNVGVSVAEITRQAATFDWATFLTANWDDRSDPVGDDLQGAADRLTDRQWVANAGVKRRNLIGGDIAIGQEIGFQNTNSQFFNPPDQATTFLSLQYNQPLLRGAGRFVNQSIIELAVIDARATEANVIAETQNIILAVTQAYWGLAAARGRFKTLRRSYDRAEAVARVMGHRTDLDVGPLQKTRADATVASRRSALVGAENDVVLAQEQLLQLILGAEFSRLVDKEVLITTPVFGPIFEVDLPSEVQTALSNRHEIHQAIEQIRGSSIEKGIARNQLLPLLSMTLAVSNRGLQGDSQLDQAFLDQWSIGAPTYGVGLEYELPVGNRAASAALRQAKFRLLKLQKDFEVVTSQVALEARAASHNAATRGRARNAREDALRLAAEELNMVVRRLELLIDGDAVGPLYLDDLLQTQARLEVAEVDFINACTDYAVSQFELQRARGTLLRSPGQYVPASGAIASGAAGFARE